MAEAQAILGEGSLPDAARRIAGKEAAAERRVVQAQEKINELNNIVEEQNN